MMKLAALAGLAVGANGLSLQNTTAVAPEHVEAFGHFMVQFGKTYSTQEELSTRMSIFAKNMDLVAQRNKQNILAGGEAVHGVTKFADLTPEEFKKTYLTYTPRNIPESERVTPQATEQAGSIDWRTKGAVTAVKDQGQCGSCWAFSATEAIESYYKLNGGQLMELSPQQINSCDKTDGGCNGGNTETAFQYVASTAGLATEADYPYTSGGGNTGRCKYDPSMGKVKITGYKSVSSGESNLKTALNSGPVSVCLAAEAFQSYTGGILTQCDNNVDHCVQAVGYDDSGSQPYWIVRNSWATDWGEQGYIRILQGRDLCKIADDVTYPTF